MLAVILSLLLTSADPSLGPGNHERSLKVGDMTRTYRIHVPPKYDAKKPTPVVLALHGAAMNAPGMADFTGLNRKADEAGFIVVYPNGTGIAGALLTWNVGGMWGERWFKRPSDVEFISKLLDDLPDAVNVDRKRVFATGVSNGAMMCYRLAAELSDRIAAIAPVAGTMVTSRAKPQRPVSVLHFHGTADRLVLFDGPGENVPRGITFLSVEDTIDAWVKIDGCTAEPKVTKLPDNAHDGTTVTRKVYGPGKEKSEVVLYVIEGGGHTWPGRDPHVKFIGKSTKNISANDLIWEFFQRHPLP
jgi:polyhydroxybutyrate depolymerase